MPVVTKYICDGCGAEKGETNHWFRIFIDRTCNPMGIKVCDWYREEFGMILCGEKCVLTEISKWMQERKEQDTDTGGVTK